MNIRYGLVCVSLLATACAPKQSLSSNPSLSSTPTISTASCTRKSSGLCNFINSPVKFSGKEINLPGRDFPFSITVEKLTFVDAKRKQWVAPVGTFSDGASIPTMFVGIMGHPRSKQFLNAAVVHDAFCATGNEKKAYYHTATWQNVHRMFYDAIRVSGVPATKAKTMYAALYLGGPRWSGKRSVRRASLDPQKQLTITQYGSTLFSPKFGNFDKDLIDHILEAKASGRGSGLRSLQSNRPLPSSVSTSRLQASLRKVKAYIEANNPSIDQLEAYLTREEGGLSGRKSTRPRKTKKSREGSDGGGDGSSGGGDGGSY